VTDAGFKHSLGAIRSLGRKGIFTVAASHRPFPVSFCSNYCNEKLIYPNPNRENDFTQFMTSYLQRKKIDVLLPIGYEVTLAIIRHQSEYDRLTKLVLASRESMEIAAEKDKTLRFAESIGIPSPKYYADKDQVNLFPVVVKPRKIFGRMRYVNSAEELSNMDTSESVIQEYIPGDGYGFFALFNKGKPRAVFMHRRVREYPITGGLSTAAESVSIPEVQEAGLKLLTALNWHGVGMVEFKRDRRDGKYKLIEVNPKFWGSLDLAIASGVDFPYLAVRMAMEGDIDPVMEYKTGVRFDWIFPDDFLHLITYPDSAPQILRDNLDKSVIKNYQKDDLLPSSYQIFIAALKTARWVMNGMPRYPHGRPELKS
jgi:predicted ATP-grasp superfamily ATP-dependent carboligase